MERSLSAPSVHLVEESDVVDPVTPERFPPIDDQPATELDHTTRAYNERRREERVQRKNALKAYQFDTARAAAAEKSRIMASAKECQRRQKLLRKYGSERERLEARLYPTEAATIPINPRPLFGNTYLPGYMRRPQTSSSLTSLRLKPPLRGEDGKPTSRPPSRSPAPFFQSGEPPPREKTFKLTVGLTVGLLPPASFRGFGAGGYDSMPMIGIPSSRCSTPYWTRT